MYFISFGCLGHCVCVGVPGPGYPPCYLLQTQPGYWRWWTSSRARRHHWICAAIWGSSCWWRDRHKSRCKLFRPARKTQQHLLKESEIAMNMKNWLAYHDAFGLKCVSGGVESYLAGENVCDLSGANKACYSLAKKQKKHSRGRLMCLYAWGWEGVPRRVCAPLPGAVSFTHTNTLADGFTWEQLAIVLVGRPIEGAQATSRTQSLCASSFWSSFHWPSSSLEKASNVKSKQQKGIFSNLYNSQLQSVTRCKAIESCELKVIVNIRLKIKNMLHLWKQVKSALSPNLKGL